MKWSQTESDNQSRQDPERRAEISHMGSPYVNSAHLAPTSTLGSRIGEFSLSSSRGPEEGEGRDSEIDFCSKCKLDI